MQQIMIFFPCKDCFVLQLYCNAGFNVPESQQHCIEVKPNCDRKKNQIVDIARNQCNRKEFLFSVHGFFIRRFLSSGFCREILHIALQHHHHRDPDFELALLPTSGSRKKSLFFIGPTNKFLTPPPLNRAQWSHYFRIFFWSFKNSFIFLVVRPLPPSPLSGPTTKKKELFFCFFFLVVRYNILLSSSR